MVWKGRFGVGWVRIIRRIMLVDAELGGILWEGGPQVELWLGIEDWVLDLYLQSDEEYRMSRLLSVIP